MVERLAKEQTGKPALTESPALAPTISAQLISVNQPSKEIEETRKSTGCGVIAAICISLAAGGSVGTLGYLYVNKEGPFAPETMASVFPQISTSGLIPSASASASASSSANTPENPDIPEIIRTNQDLKLALQTQKIMASAKDFDFETKRPELQAKAVFLTPSANTDDTVESNKYSWKPVRERITRTDQKELLVAVKIINSNVGNDAFRLIVQEGLSYRARTMDDKDPSIMYFYYNCQDKKGEKALLAQIGIKDPLHSKKLMWARSFMLPICE